jgi:hypothetical protein
MKFSIFSLIVLATAAAASPIVKRASVTDAAPYGYATMNGGLSLSFPSHRVYQANK